MAKFNHDPASSPSIQKFHVALDGQEAKSIGLRRPAHFSVELDLSNLMPMFKVAGQSLGQESTCALGALVVRSTQEQPVNRFVVTLFVSSPCGNSVEVPNHFTVDALDVKAARAIVTARLDELGAKAGEYFWGVPDSTIDDFDVWQVSALDDFSSYPGHAAQVESCDTAVSP